MASFSSDKEPEKVASITREEGDGEDGNSDAGEASAPEPTESTEDNPYPEFPAYNRKSPVVILVIGMAGSGKTTLMHRINLSMNEMGKKAYYVNLDPAVRTVPYAANIDIRDTVNYKEVMSQYGLGPNGAILTSLNLFATRFDQVIGLLERRADSLDYIFVDTPGQIEAFTWSAGGQIISELLGSSFPTCILYVTDTPRCTSPTTFMSNMLYACSILFKTHLPLVCVFNKIDVAPCEFALEWMRDFESFQDSLDADRSEDYMGPLNRSLSLGMDEFYRNMKACGVSAVSGAGMDELLTAVDAAGLDFKETFLPEIVRRIKLRKEAEAAKQKDSMERLAKDLKELRP
jgi:GTPase SAR1 family protein